MQAWSTVMLKVRKTGLFPSTWHQLVVWGFHALKRKIVRNLIVKLAFQACVYHTWKERNSRVHTHVAQSEVAIISLVMHDVPNRLQSLSKPIYRN